MKLANPRRNSSRSTRIAAWLAVLGLFGIGVFAFLAWQPSMPEQAAIAASDFSPDAIEHGRRLASAGFCNSCHTVADGKPLAGGYAMRTGFGTIYSTNISPDRDTGIGTWSEAAFRRAMRDGVARDGSHLFPAFPYDHFTHLSDGDIHALYAFVMTREPVHQADHPNEMPFPLGLRPLQAGWKLLFFHPEPLQQEGDPSSPWNRGKYLAESLSHCSACHTPRGLLGQELKSRLYRGASIDGWWAPALTAGNAAPAPWTSRELHDYLTAAVSPYHGTAGGPMASVSRGLAALTPEDQRALVTYVESLGSGDARAADTAPAVATALAADAADSKKIDEEGARLYVAACASCHYNRGPDVIANRPDLGLNSAVYLDDPSNLIQVILNGIDAEDGAPGIAMPAFGRGLDDERIVLIATYLRRTRTDRPPWPHLEQQVAKLRRAAEGETR
jgi:mono/diheme cytochrome c family protein